MVKVTMSQLGESVTEGTIDRWLEKPGDRVVKDDPVVEVITDKVNAEVPSPFAATLTAILVEEGATVPSGTEIAVVAEEAGEAAIPTRAETTMEAASPATTVIPAAGQVLAAAPAAPAPAALAAPTPPRRRHGRRRADEDWFPGPPGVDAVGAAGGMARCAPARAGRAGAGGGNAHDRVPAGRG